MMPFSMMAIGLEMLGQTWLERFPTGTDLVREVPIGTDLVREVSNWDRPG
jgi:hypothetical protein